MKGIVVLFCVLLEGALALPIETSHVDYKIELETNDQMLDELRHSEIIIGGEKINLDRNLNNEQIAKIGLLSGYLQGLPTAAPTTSGGVNYVFFSPLSALIQKLKPTTTTTSTAATTTTSTSTASTATTTSPTTTTPTTTSSATPSTTTTTTTTTTPIP